MKVTVITSVILTVLSVLVSVFFHGGPSLFCMSLFVVSLIAVFIGAGGSGRRGIPVSRLSSRDLSPLRQLTFMDMTGEGQKNVEGNGDILKAGLICLLLSFLFARFSN